MYSESRLKYRLWTLSFSVGVSEVPGPRGPRWHDGVSTVGTSDVLVDRTRSPVLRDHDRGGLRGHSRRRVSGVHSRRTCTHFGLSVRLLWADGFINDGASCHSAKTVYLESRVGVVCPSHRDSPCPNDPPHSALVAVVVRAGGRSRACLSERWFSSRGSPREPYQGSSGVLKCPSLGPSSYPPSSQTETRRPPQHTSSTPVAPDVSKSGPRTRVPARLGPWTRLGSQLVSGLKPPRLPPLTSVGWPTDLTTTSSVVD